MEKIRKPLDVLDKFYHNLRDRFSKNKELTNILAAQDLASSMDCFFKKIGVKMDPFSVEDFVEKTFVNNSLIFKKLRDFLEEQWIDKETMRSNKEILSHRKQYIQEFDNQNLFLSRTFSSDAKNKYESHIKKTFYQIEWNIFRKFLLQSYFTKYQKKYIQRKLFWSNQVDTKKRKERVWVRCFEDIDKEYVNKIDVTTLSKNDQEKLKKTFLYKKIFPHFCSYAPYSFRYSLEWKHENNIHIGTPSGIFLYNQNQLLYTKPDQENISAIDLNKDRDTSLWALNDFDFLLVMSLYRDKSYLSSSEIKQKYSSFWTLEEKNGIWFFKKNEKINLWSPGNSEKPERIEDASTREKKYRSADKMLFDVVNLSREIAKTNLPI